MRLARSPSVGKAQSTLLPGSRATRVGRFCSLIPASPHPGPPFPAGAVEVVPSPTSTTTRSQPPADSPAPGSGEQTQGFLIRAPAACGWPAGHGRHAQEDDIFTEWERKASSSRQLTVSMACRPPGWISSPGRLWLSFP